MKKLPKSYRVVRVQKSILITRRMYVGGVWNNAAKGQAPSAYVPAGWPQ